MPRTPQGARSAAAHWEIRPYRDGDERQIVELFDRVFGRRISEAHWRWKFRSLPSPAENVWLAVRDGEPVCHYGGIPCRFLLPGGEATAMVSVDTMTHPDLRRRGIFTETVRHAFEHWGAAGVPFVLGLPNEQWGSRVSALGVEPLFEIEWLVRPLRPWALMAPQGARDLSLGAPLDAGWNALWNRKIGTDATVEVEPVESIAGTAAEAALDGLWRAGRDDLEISVVRDAAWVAWRYLAGPSIQYRLLLATRGGEGVGYLAYRTKTAQGRELGFVADLFTTVDDEAAQMTLIGRAIEEMRAAGTHAVLVLAIRATPLQRTLRRAGFVFSRGSFTVQMVPFNSALPLQLAREPRRWCLAGGDFDVL